jgi:hypothetical protein
MTLRWCSSKVLLLNALLFGLNLPIEKFDVPVSISATTIHVRDALNRAVVVAPRLCWTLAGFI